MKVNRIFIFGVFLALGIALNTNGQKLAKESDVYDEVEEMPIYPGGVEALKLFLAKNVVYPQKAVEDSITGKVICSFIVDEKGKVIQPTIKRGVNPLLDKEALRVVSLMPNWTAGKENGKPVKVQFTVPINYALN